MLSGALADIFYIQLHAVLNTVDAFMLGPVVHECPLDILHPGNQKNITDENQNPDTPSAMEMSSWESVSF